MLATRIRIAVEVIVSIVFLALPFVVVPAIAPVQASLALRPVLWGTVLIHSVIIVYYFAAAYYGLPRLFFGGKTKRFILFSLGFLAVSILVALSDPAFNPFAYRPVPNDTVVFVLSVIARFLVITFIAIAVVSNVRLRRSDEERLRSELAYLRAQVNPHFLFNTLNSIYALTVTRSDKAPLAVTQLASIMRYVLDKSAAEEVPLREELNSLKAYIELEKLRLTENVQLIFTVRGDGAGKNIVPLLLMPLVENAFKHGVDTEAPCTIAINVEVFADHLVMTVQNNRHSRERENRTGLGLANLRKRIALLQGNNTLEIKENDHTFEAALRVALK